MRNPRESPDNVDELIREALGREEAAWYDRLGPPSLIEMMADVYRGRLRWLAALWSFWVLVLFGLAVWCGVRFFQASEIRDMLIWGAGCAFGLMFTLGLKIWFWMDMQRSTTSREIKRLELQIASLAAKLGHGGEV